MVKEDSAGVPVAEFSETNPHPRTFEKQRGSLVFV